MIRAALLIIDCQEDFCPPNGALAVEDGRAIMPTINKLLELPFILRIATQDWHPPEHVSFASAHPAPDNVPFQSVHGLQHPENAPVKPVNIRLWPDHCVQNTKGAELVPELDTSNCDVVLKKGQDSRVEMLSAFVDVFGADSCVMDSGLLRVLKDARVSQVFVVGLAADFCVKHTAIDACKAGFKSFVVGDATRAVASDDKSLRALQKELEEAGVTSVAAADVPSMVR